VRARFIAAPACLLAVLLDQVTKIQCERLFLPLTKSAGHAPTALLVAVGIPPANATGVGFAVEVSHVTNRGITLGLLENGPPVVPVTGFYATTALGLAAGFWAVRHAAFSPIQRIGGLLLVTGVVANLLDRLRVGHVVDWLVVSWQVPGWRVELPAFNLADTYITAALFFVAIGLLGRRRARTIEDRPAADTTA